MITYQNAVLVSFKHFESELLVQIRSKTLDQNYICEANSIRDTELRVHVFQHEEFYPIFQKVAQNGLLEIGSLP